MKMEASVDPQCRGPDWMPITPKTGSLFHAETHLRGFCALDRFDRAQHRTVLEQLVATTDPLVKQVFRQEILDAREILRRLPFGPLTQEEEDALWSL